MRTQTVYAIKNTKTNEFFSQGTGEWLTRWRAFPKFTPYITRRWASRKLNMIVQSRAKVAEEELGIVAVQVSIPEAE
jgi:hypothetical protein